MTEVVIPDDAIVIIKREGGIGYFPNLAAPKEVSLADLAPTTRDRLRKALLRLLEILDLTPVKGGDQRRYSVRVTNTGRDVVHLEFIVSEEQAPQEIPEMWKLGGNSKSEGKNH